jgi:hypothetical protein
LGICGGHGLFNQGKNGKSDGNTKERGVEIKGQNV